jgi:hypothetical protein
VQPSWWEAVRKVPPTAFVPRIKKKTIPRITFLEDKLIRCVSTLGIWADRAAARGLGAAPSCRSPPSPPPPPAPPPPLACSGFEGKNPVLAQFDSFASSRQDPRTVASIFAAKQAAAMRNDATEEEAYGVAKAWMIDHGRDVLLRMGVLADEATAARAAAREYKEAMAAQTAATRAALRSQLYARQAYRSFLEPEEVHALATRALSAEPVLPTAGREDAAAAEESDAGRPAAPAAAGGATTGASGGDGKAGR